MLELRFNFINFYYNYIAQIKGKMGYFRLISLTPECEPTNAISAPLLANNPTVTTPAILFILFSSAIGSAMIKSWTSKITLPLSVTTPWR